MPKLRQANRSENVCRSKQAGRNPNTRHSSIGRLSTAESHAVSS